MPLNHLQKLIQFKTFSADHGENFRAMQWVVAQIKNLPVHLRHITRDGFPSLIITTQKTKTPKVWLVGHMDVVSGSVDLFRPRLVGHRLYGRGVFDMKYAIACYLQLLQDLKKELHHLDFGIMLTSDEEIGSRCGAQYLVEDLGYSGKVAVVPDSGVGWSLRTSAKGGWQVRVQTTGESGHGSRPWEGRNAAEELLEYLHVVRKNFTSEPCGKKGHLHPTLNVGKITAGNVANQIPDFAEALLDVRFPPGMTKVKVQQLLRKPLRRFRHTTLIEQAWVDSYAVRVKDPLVRLFGDIAKKEGVRMTSGIGEGSCDARFFTKNNIPAIVLRPNGGGHHSEKEWIDVRDLQRFYRILGEYVKMAAR